ncbi:PIG-L deacetylase family protein [Solimicrobium silvestre]|uniref:GlcNAc-PI de-N-acetylase n=1 Tax=Solimicrobium silvestre TaxID=2099400 RepID=A0A2S9H267_9BURK|nr:PIG-L family deacetylase [Solimicrobium silvestre]PRC93956.1 GlcNAc-PI de-N-acetylase [Solimicrobium silvestre]
MKITTSTPVALFLFAHQDDEFGVFHAILSEVNQGHRIICAYLTNGHAKNVTSEIRNQESISVLLKLGVKKQDIFFPGDTLNISDSKLLEHLERASNWLKEILSEVSNLAAIYIPAWEGGHQDHDALHALTVCTTMNSDVFNRVRQFPLYNRYLCIGSFFRVLSPLPSNGVVEKINIPLKNRIDFLRYCLSYPSQLVTWIGLFPFVFLHYVFIGKQQLQHVSYERIFQRPHSGFLYYEKRRFFTWEQMENCLLKWIDINNKNKLN